MTKMTDRAQEIKKRFIKHYKNAKTELRFNNLYELLVAVMLSARCTDKRVNIITPALFKTFTDIKSLANADIKVLKELIKSCSFFNNKSKNLIAMAKIVQDKFNAKIPLDEKKLLMLPGVGQKTAHVVLIEYANANFMAVDTHVFRVSHRLGLTKEKTPQKVESDLVKKFQNNLNILHQGMVLFGRYICKAKNPLCNDCFVKEFCQNGNV